LDSLFGSIAYAQTAAVPGGASSPWASLVPIVLMIAIFYFLLIRPSQKKEKDRKKMIDALQKGDKVLTAGGMYGVVVNIKPEENIVVLKIGEGAKVEFAKSAISAKIS
jgi:preprotein translocase subunit YajC